MPVAVLLFAAVAAGLLTAAVAALGGRGHSPPRRAVLLLASAGLAVVGLLGVVLHHDPRAIGLDASAALWSRQHATSTTTRIIHAVTDVGQPTSVGVLAALVALAGVARGRSRSHLAFVAAVLGSTWVLTSGLKQLVDRARPTSNLVTQAHGAAFPSGHASWAAASLAAAALLLSLGGGPRRRLALAGVASGGGVAVASSRVLLDVHWLSDAAAGLVVGWSCFALCRLAFGPRLGAR